MRKEQIEKTLKSGRQIICYTRNGNRHSASGATIMLIEKGHSRAGCQRLQTGVIATTETTCFKGNVGWSAKKEAAFLDGEE